MKHALYDPRQTRNEGIAILQVEDAAFPVAAPFNWIDCADDVTPTSHVLKAGVIERLPDKPEVKGPPNVLA